MTIEISDFVKNACISLYSFPMRSILFIALYLQYRISISTPYLRKQLFYAFLFPKNFNDFQLSGRYPDYYNLISNLCTKEYTFELLYFRPISNNGRNRLDGQTVLPHPPVFLCPHNSTPTMSVPCSSAISQAPSRHAPK